MTPKVIASGIGNNNSGASDNAWRTSSNASADVLVNKETAPSTAARCGGDKNRTDAAIDEEEESCASTVVILCPLTTFDSSNAPPLLSNLVSQENIENTDIAGPYPSKHIALPPTNDNHNTNSGIVVFVPSPPHHQNKKKSMQSSRSNRPFSMLPNELVLPLTTLSLLPLMESSNTPRSSVVHGSVGDRLSAIVDTSEYATCNVAIPSTAAVTTAATDNNKCSDGTQLLTGRSLASSKSSHSAKSRFNFSHFRHELKNSSSRNSAGGEDDKHSDILSPPNLDTPPVENVGRKESPQNNKEDPYEWAYKIWRSKKLLPSLPLLANSYLLEAGKNERVPSKTSLATSKLIQNKVDVAKKESSGGKGFVNVLEQWKQVSSENDFVKPNAQSSSKRLVVERKQQPQPSILMSNGVPFSRRHSCEPALRNMNGNALSFNQSRGTVVKNVVGAPVLSSNRMSTVPKPRHAKALVSSRHSIAAPSPQKVMFPREDESISPVHETPKSQAWKLITSRSHPQTETHQVRQRAVGSKRASLTVETPSSVVVTSNLESKSFRPCLSPPMSRTDYKTVVKDFLQGNLPYSHVKSPPALVSENDLILELTKSAVLKADQPKETVILTMSSDKIRSKSQPRPRPGLHFEPSVPVFPLQSQRHRESSKKASFTAISSVTAGQKDSPTLVFDTLSIQELSSMPQRSTRVIDLSVSALVTRYTPNQDVFENSIPREVRIASDASKALFSPFTERVMRNLEKVYDDESAIVPTPNGAATYSERPWQRDNFMRQVDRLTEEEPNSAMETCPCTCANSLFSGNDDMINFYLPLMGTACSCGNNKSSPRIMASTVEPTSLVHILRPWQVAFLEGFGIYRGEELVKANHRSGAALANALQRYRKREGMLSFRRKSCVMALQIWSKTSKAFVRSIRSQIKTSRRTHVVETSVKAMERNSTTGKLTINDSPSNASQPPLRLPNTLYILSSFLEQMPHSSSVLPSVPSSGDTTTGTNNIASSISSCSQSSCSISATSTPTSLISSKKPQADTVGKIERPE